MDKEFVPRHLCRYTMNDEWRHVVGEQRRWHFVLAMVLVGKHGVVIGAFLVLIVADDLEICDWELK